MLRMELTGQRFGRLVVYAEAPQRGSLRYWKVRCDCGQVREVHQSHLRRRLQTSCGCGRILQRVPPRISGGVLYLSLGHGRVTLVDALDAPLVQPFLWHLSGGYAARTPDRIRLHTLLFPQSQSVDHRNGNRLDNRRLNLRPATVAQQVWNTGLRKDNLSGFKGVGHYRDGRWRARIQQQLIGYFQTPEEAARAYDAEARSRYGDFARLNFPTIGETSTGRRPYTQTSPVVVEGPE